MSATSATPSREEILSTVRRFVDTANNGDLQASIATHSPDCVVHFPGFPDMDFQSWQPFMLSYFSAFPDLQINVNWDDAIIEGNRLAGRYTMTGTHLADFMGIPATGKSISVFGINIFYIRDGKIVEEWDLSDGLGMMQQLGLIPAPDAVPVG
jgi:steroid delta-isomerase-like uncharacterized protein